MKGVSIIVTETARDYIFRQIHKNGTDTMIEVNDIIIKALKYDRRRLQENNRRLRKRRNKVG